MRPIPVGGVFSKRRPLQGLSPTPGSSLFLTLQLFCVLEEEVEEEEEEISKATGYSYHTVVLDCAPIAFIDSTGIAVLEQVSREFKEIENQYCY